MINLTIVSVLIMLSVLLFVNRIYYQLKKQHLLPEKTLTKIGTLHLVFVFSLYIFYFSKPFSLWIYSFLSITIIPFFILLITKFYQQQFYGEFLRFLSMLILKMQIGNSFRSAMETVIQEGGWRQRSLLVHIYENVVFTQQEEVGNSGPFARFISQIVEEFIRVQNNQHQAIDRLCNFRKKMQSEQFFRRRSRQIWIYFGNQLVLLSVIYLLIFVYVLKHYGFQKFSQVFMVSFGLYSIGCFVVYILGRSKKWHI